MEKLKIALCDLRHRTRGLHSYTMPLSIGFLATYALKHMKDTFLDIRLYTYAEKIIQDISDWQPHIVGASTYVWNRNLTLDMLSIAKNSNNNTITVIGGPEIDMDTPKRRQFLMEMPQVDICCFGEGEETFFEILKWLKNGKSQNELQSVRGIYYLDSERAIVETPQRDGVRNLDEIPSPYTSGLFDQYFEDNLHPIMGTTRGCPFGCTFCRMSLKIYNAVRFHSLERVTADLDYCARKYQERHDIQLVIVDSNFGMYEQNIPFAKAIRKVQESLDWPRYINISTGKNKKERMVEVSNIFKWGIPIKMSAQSTNEKTLKVIKRENISLDIMRATFREAKNLDANPVGELIIPLPEETIVSFERGIKEMVEMNLNAIWIMTLAVLKGTPIADQEMADKYGYKIMHRVVSRQFGEYGGKRIIETEPVVVGTNTMSEEEYLYARELFFILHVSYNADFFNLIRRFLLENDIDIWQWIKGIYLSCKNGNGKPHDHFEQYSKETMDELYESPQHIYEFFADDTNYKRLLDGELGDNLINKYSTIAFADAFHEWLDVVSENALNLAKQKYRLDRDKCKYIDNAIENINNYIKICYDFAPYFNNFPKPDQKQSVSFDFDIQRWAEDATLSLPSCKKPTIYNVFFTKVKVDRIKQLIKSSHDISFTIQRVYRDKNYDELMPLIETIT